jgi:hypothetical protein
MRNAPAPLRALVVEDRLLPATAFVYVHCDVPASMTLDEWRLGRGRARRAARLDARRERRAARAARVARVANLCHGIGRR